jgi:hypothetical protein
LVTIGQRHRQRAHARPDLDHLVGLTACRFGHLVAQCGIDQEVLPK